MESIGDILGKRQDIRENFEKLVAEVLKNADVQAFIAQHQMTSDEIQRSYSKFYEYVREHEKFEKGEKRAADGYEPVLIMNHGYADVSYQTTNELAQQQAAQNLLRRMNIIGLPKDLKQGTRVKNIRIVEGDHNIDCKIDGFGAMKLKSEFVTKI